MSGGNGAGDRGEPRTLPGSEHEARTLIIGELHARPILPLGIPRRIYHFAFLTTEEEAENDRRAVAALASADAAVPSFDHARFEMLESDGWELRWERHTEFVTHTWSTSENACKPFVHPDPGRTNEIKFRAAGKLVVALDLALLESDEPTTDLAQWFDAQSLCVIRAGEGKARVLTDFKADAYGYTRFLVAANGLGPMAAGRLVQRILEIETYRTLSLLGLPEARRAAPELGRMEREIADIAQALSHSAARRMSEELLQRLSDLLAQSVAQSARTGFRFGASRAYHALVKSRLELIDEAKENEHVTITQFFRGRLDPAIETCNAVERRQTRLLEQVARTADLLRAGIQLEVEQQNRDLLKDMNRRAELQLRLQRTVQGLSIAALSYYLGGLVMYLAHGAEDAALLPKGVTAGIVAAAALPFVVFAAWLFMERVRRASFRAKKDTVR
jgi:uncharacterized membrane-anchored protein